MSGTQAAGQQNPGDRQGDQDRASSGGWRWGNRILQDDSTHAIYTTFEKNGIVKLARIDHLTGRITSETVIPFPFPEKIRITGNQAFFLYRPSGPNENWRLVRCPLH